MQCRLYGSNICGEGGEYETLALGGPLFLHAFIHLDEWDIRLHSQDSVAPVGVLHPISIHLESTAAETATEGVAGPTGSSVVGAADGGASMDEASLGPLASRVINVPSDFWAAAEDSKEGVPRTALIVCWMRSRAAMLHRCWIFRQGLQPGMNPLPWQGPPLPLYLVVFLTGSVSQQIAVGCA